jgi:hypothetical protein
VIGANEDGYHFENAQLDRDFNIDSEYFVPSLKTCPTSIPSANCAFPEPSLKGSPSKH